MVAWELLGELATGGGLAGGDQVGGRAPPGTCPTIEHNIDSFHRIKTASQLSRSLPRRLTLF